MNSRRVTAKPEHEVLYQDIVDLVRKHADKMTSMEVLAVAANMVGKLIALQDQRVTSPDVAMATVAHNIELGNQQALEELTKKSSGSA